MGVIHRRVTTAFRAHWRAHDGKSPQRLVLTEEQADDLLRCQQYGRVASTGAEAPSPDSFFERPIEIRDDTPGQIVAHDGTVTPLSDYDSLK